MSRDSERHYWDALRGSDWQLSRLAANRLSSLLRQRGKQVAAERLLRRSLREHGREHAAGTLLRLANLLREEGRVVEAGRTYAQALSVATVEECPEVVIDLAARCVDASELERAAELYERVAADASRAPLRALAAYRLAAIQLRLDSANRAIGTLRDSLMEADASLEPFVLVDLAKLLIDEGEAKEAAKLLQQAIDSDHHDQAPRAALALAELRRREGDPFEAYSNFQLVVESEHPRFAPMAEWEQQRLIHFEIDPLVTVVHEPAIKRTTASESSGSNRLTVFLDSSACSLYRESFKPDLLATWVECERSWTFPRHRQALLRDSLLLAKPQDERGFVFLPRRRIGPAPRPSAAVSYPYLSIAAYGVPLPFQLSWAVALCEDLLVTWLARRLLADGNLRTDGSQAPGERLLFPSLPKDRATSSDEQSPLALDLLAPESPRCDTEAESGGLFLRRPRLNSCASNWFVHTLHWFLASRALESEPAEVVQQPDGDCLCGGDAIAVAGSLGDGCGEP